MTDRRESLAAIKRLLAESVDSFEKLEVLVHLYRAGFGAHTTTTLAAALSTPEHALVDVLSALMRDGLVRTTDQDGARWWFDRSGSMAPTVESLVKLYEADRIEVMQLMTQLALERVRSEAARVFADAFVIRPKKKKGGPDA